jgi:hypothetical protein
VVAELQEGNSSQGGISNHARPVALHAAASDMSKSGLLGFELLANSPQLDKIQGGHGAKHAAEHDYHNTVH